VSEYYTTKLAEGSAFEKFVYSVLRRMGLIITRPHTTKGMQLKGENSIGWEIKYDNLMTETGNVYIETAEKSDPRNATYIKSGVYRDDNTWMWVIGDYSELFIIQKNLLKMLIETGRYRKIENKRRSSMGYLIPKKVIRKYAGIVIHPDSSGIT